MAKLTYIVTNSVTAYLGLRGQLAEMRRQGFDVCVVSSPGTDLTLVAEREGVNVVGIPMEREIHLFKDLISLYRLFIYLRREKPEIVNASTPKAGLLGMVAAWLAGISVRIYLVRGLRLETTSGLRRILLTLTEQISGACANWVVCNSPSLMSVYSRENLAVDGKIIMLGKGSSNGIDSSRFDRGRFSDNQIEELRKSLDLPSNAKTIGFVGRLVKDKGISELFEAFLIVKKSIPNTYLLLVGRFEEGDPLLPDEKEQIQEDENIILVGHVSDTAPYYHLMDVLAFPSYREGFPNVPLEAGVAGLPTVGFRSTGTIDAVEDGVTGILVSSGDSVALATSLIQVLEDQELRVEMGNAARQRSLNDFSCERVWQEWYDFYQDCLYRNVS